MAATAPVHGLSLATRNTDDLRGIALEVINPWQPGKAVKKEK
jgi:predicted nucleic acid-binding protein